jgi:hypothetical protein
MKKSDMTVLKQLVNTLEETGDKLEDSYEKKDLVSFNGAKKSMLQIKRKIEGLL